MFYMEVSTPTSLRETNSNMASFKSAAQNTTYTETAPGVYQFADSYGRTIDNITYNGLPDDVKSQVAAPTGPVPVLQTSDSVNGTAKSGSTGPGPDSILVTPTKTYVTSGKADVATKVVDKGTDTPGGYSSVYGDKPVDVVNPPSGSKKNPAVTTNAQDAAAAEARNGTPAPQPAIPQTPGVPVGGFKPGQTGAEVKALQDMLVSRGYMTAAQVATGPGVYGPKTQAALAKYQADTGTSHNPTPQADAPSPYVNKPATPEAPAKSAVQQVVDDYTAAYNALGLGDIKTQYEDFVKQEADLAKEKADKADAITNNPWLSQGLKDQKLNQLDKSYETRESILTSKVALLDSLYKQGQAEVNNVVNKAEAITMEQQKEAADIAQKKQDAIDKLNNLSPSEKYGTGSIGEYNFAVSQGYKGSFTQYQNEDANRKAKAAGSGTTTTPKTLAERNAVSLADLQRTIDGAAPGAGLVDTNGYLTVKGLKQIIAGAPSQGLTGSDVILQVQNSLSPNFDKKGNPISGTVSDAYGLTTSQKKLLGITP
jgi:hypothetical protein